MAYHRRRRRFGSVNRGAVLQSTMIARKRSKCRACSLPFEKGDEVVRLRLRKTFRNPCVTCGHKLLGVRWYHPTCVPLDLNKAMGFDPAQPYGAAPATTGAPPPPPTHQVSPPPKPQTAADASLSALLAIENALKRRLAENPALAKDVQVAKTLDTYNGCKAHALRNKNDNEARLGMKNALKRSLDLIF